MHAGISALRLSHFLRDHRHTPLPELKVGPAATNKHESRHTGGEETLKTPDKKGSLTNINNIFFLFWRYNPHRGLYFTAL